MDNLRETPLTRTTVYRGLIVNVNRDTVSLPNGHTAGREVVEHPGGVAVLPLDESGIITMVRQFRYPNGMVTLEIPAGKVEPGEDPVTCGVRELREEAGYTAGRFEPLGVIDPSPGYSTERLYLYLARDLSFAGLKPDEDELLELVELPLAEAVQMVYANEITDAKTALAALLTNQKLREEGQP